MKPLTLHPHEIRQCLQTGSVLVVRVVKLTDPSQTYAVHDDDGWPVSADECGDWHRDLSPFGPIGSRLWCRESYAQAESLKDGSPSCRIAYRADGQCVGCGGDGAGGNIQIFHGWLFPDVSDKGPSLGRTLYGPWKPANQMKLWMSRLTVTATAISVKRVQDVTEREAGDAGVEAAVFDQTIGTKNYETGDWFISWEDDGPKLEELNRLSFKTLWNKLNPKHPWESNAWVWVGRMERVGT